MGCEGCGWGKRVGGWGQTRKTPEIPDILNSQNEEEECEGKFGQRLSRKE